MYRPDLNYDDLTWEVRSRGQACWCTFSVNHYTTEVKTVGNNEGPSNTIGDCAGGEATAIAK